MTNDELKDKLFRAVATESLFYSDSSRNYPQGSIQNLYIRIQKLKIEVKNEPKQDSIEELAKLIVMLIDAIEKNKKNLFINLVYLLLDSIVDN
jgi:hypothetical protein